jgi:hypothetical protein
MAVKPKISARELVSDIRDRMTDAQLMEKYQLSANGLQSAFEKLLETKAITRAELEWRPTPYQDTQFISRMIPEEAVVDIRSGMNDFELMEKYNLSPNGLRRAFQSLVDAGLITREELSNRCPGFAETVFIESLRELPRHFLAIAVTIYDRTRPEVSGTLRDITEKGVGVSGISAKLGEVKILAIPAEKFIDADPILFEARCVWVDKEGAAMESRAGFQVTKISERCLQDLRRLIRSLSFNE